MSWSRHGYENASYCISHTGRQPARHRPTAPPSSPASASGVSTQRSGPNVSRSPAVARKTPPARPTSSPSTITFGSRASSWWRQSLIASTSVSSAMPALRPPRRASPGQDPPQLGELVLERRGRAGVGVLEEQRRVGVRLGLRAGDRLAHRVRRLGAHGLAQLVVDQPAPPQVALEAPDALPLARLLDTVRVDVLARVVRGRVRRRAVRHR